MPRFGSILDRFRRLVAPPGRPAEAIGVPDSGAEVEAELAPVLGDLAGIDAEATRIEREAEARAADIRAGAQRQAATIIAQARDQAPAERARARDARLARAQGDGEAVRADSRREAERIRAQRADAVEALVVEVLACAKQTGR